MHKIYDPEFYKVVFFSSAPIGVPFLEKLSEDKRFDVTGVVTMPDAPAGRGMKMQENVVKTKAKQLWYNNTIRYFFLKESFQNNREKTLEQKNIVRIPHENRWVIIYGDEHTYEQYVTLFQSLLVDGPWYFDTQGTKNCIVYKDEIFDLNKGESEQAKVYGKSLWIPDKQLDWESPSIQNDNNDFIQTPNSLRLDSKKYAEEAEAFQQWLADKKPDFLVVIAYGKIIPQHILDIPTFWPINVHGSILPKYRGASPIQSVFLDNEKETGITIMKMDAGLDTGDMIDIAKFPIAFDWTAKDIIGKMQDIWPQFLVDTLRKYGKWLLGEVKQDDAQATHCGKIEKEEWLIDPYKDTIQSIYQKYRAYILWPKIYFIHGDKRVIVEQLVLDETLFAENNNQPLIENNKTNPCIKTLMVKPEGSKSQLRDDFVKGYM